jgi:hypothetical protein
VLRPSCSRWAGWASSTSRRRSTGPRLRVRVAGPGPALVASPLSLRLFR